MSGPVESLHDRGRAAVLAGTESVDVPPNPSSPRWGLSVLLRPDDDCAGRLADQAAQLAALAGPHHWQTGGRGASHLTVCVLEPFREGVTPDDPHVRRAAAALSRAAARSAPVRFRLSGLLLAPGGVLAGGTPINPPAHRLRRIVADELGEAGRFEGSYRVDHHRSARSSTAAVCSTGWMPVARWIWGRSPPTGSSWCATRTTAGAPSRSRSRPSPSAAEPRPPSATAAGGWETMPCPTAPPKGLAICGAHA